MVGISAVNSTKQVKFIVLPLSTNNSGPPRISDRGSVIRIFNPHVNSGRRWRHDAKFIASKSLKYDEFYQRMAHRAFLSTHSFNDVTLLSRENVKLLMPLT